MMGRLKTKSKSYGKNISQFPNSKFVASVFYPLNYFAKVNKVRIRSHLNILFILNY